MQISTKNTPHHYVTELHDLTVHNKEDWRVVQGNIPLLIDLDATWYKMSFLLQ
jgi:hypothetical protein